MAKHLSSYNLFDGALDEIAEKYGGWPRLLDPAHSTPLEFIVELEKSGHSEYTFESIKKQIGKPERQYWIAVIAYIVKGLKGANSQDLHEEMLDEYLPKVKEHAITDDEIKRAISGSQ